MELLLERIEEAENYTVGRLSIVNRVDDEYLAGEEKKPLYDTLEPKIKDLGKRGGYTITKRAAIPVGRYPVVITYCKRQDRWLPLLLWVSRFEDVRIQVGKTVEDIAVGGIIIGVYRGEGRIVNAPSSVFGLKELIVKAKKRNEPVFITIKNVVE